MVGFKVFHPDFFGTLSQLIELTEMKILLFNLDKIPAKCEESFKVK